MLSFETRAFDDLTAHSWRPVQGRYLRAKKTIKKGQASRKLIEKKEETKQDAKDKSNMQK